MSPTLDIPAHEAGMIRVFAVNRPPADVQADLKRMPVADLARDLLNAPHLDTASAEVFPVSDLSGVGLGAYLSEGYAVEPAALDADRARLDALGGYVMLLFSDSFAGAAATLSPGAEVTLIGTYAEFKPEGAGKPVRSKSAQPYSGTAATPSAPAKRSAMGSIIVLLALVIASGLGLWWMLR